jgi:hypothetical protein
VAGSTYNVIAREVTGPERDRYWEQGCRMYPAWNLYRARAQREMSCPGPRNLAVPVAGKG